MCEQIFPPRAVPPANPPRSAAARSGLSRRSLGALAVGGLALVPFRSRAAGAGIDALAVVCIDYRFVSPEVAYLDKHVGLEKYDLVGSAGASLAAVSEMFPASVAHFWNQVAIARRFHDIKRIVFIDHMGCGAFATEFNLPTPADERRMHPVIMHKAKAAIAQRHPDLGTAFYLGELDAQRTINEVIIR